MAAHIHTHMHAHTTGHSQNICIIHVYMYIHVHMYNSQAALQSCHLVEALVLVCLFSSSSSAPVLTEAVPLSTDISCFRPTTTTTYTHIGTSSLGIKSHGSHVTYIHVAKMQVPLAHACLFNTHHLCTQASIHTRTSRSHYIPLPPSSLS